MRRFFIRYLLLGLSLLLMTACGSRFGMGAADPTATTNPVPTFTPTPAEPAQPTAMPEKAEPVVVLLEETPTPSEEPAEDLILLPTPTPVSDSPIPEAEIADETPPTDTPSQDPSLVIDAEAVNVRGGPGVNYPLIGAAVAGEQFALVGRNEVGDWWQACCFDDQPGWFYGPLVEVRNEDAVAIAADIPTPPTAEPQPAAEAAPDEPEPVVEEVPSETEPVAEAPPSAAPVSIEHSGTAGNFDPNAQYQIVNYRVIGYGENNGGIFDNGGQHMIFVNVIDGAGNGIDGAVIKDAVDDKLNVITGSKGPGRAEFEMFWERYKLYVAADSSGDVTSQISNQMNTAYPHVPDIIGKLGPVEEEYAICPTPDDRCEPPFFHAHWSYEITFQKVK